MQRTNERAISGEGGEVVFAGVTLQVLRLFEFRRIGLVSSPRGTTLALLQFVDMRKLFAGNLHNGIAYRAILALRAPLSSIEPSAILVFDRVSTIHR